MTESVSAAVMVSDFLNDHLEGRRDAESLQAAALACVEKLSPPWDTPKIEWHIEVTAKENALKLRFMPKILVGRRIIYDYDHDKDEFVVLDMDTTLTGRSPVELMAFLDLAKKLHWRIQ